MTGNASRPRASWLSTHLQQRLSVRRHRWQGVGFLSWRQLDGNFDSFGSITDTPVVWASEGTLIRENTEFINPSSARRERLNTLLTISAVVIAVLKTPPSSPMMGVASPFSLCFLINPKAQGATVYIYSNRFITGFAHCSSVFRNCARSDSNDS